MKMKGVNIKLQPLNNIPIYYAQCTRNFAEHFAATMKTNWTIECLHHYAIRSFKSPRTLIALTLQREVVRKWFAFHLLQFAFIICLLVYLYILLSTYLSVYSSIYLCIYLSINPSTSPSIHPFIFVFIYLSIYLSMSVWLIVLLWYLTSLPV